MFILFGIFKNQNDVEFYAQDLISESRQCFTCFDLIVLKLKMKIEHLTLRS